MKIAVFSDVHGNLKALKAVLEQIRAQKADEIVFLGDIFQRGNEEFECLEMLKNSNAVCIKGNCELYTQYGVDVDPDVEHLRGYYDGIRSRITEEQMQFISQMPLFYERECGRHRIRFSHFLFSDTELPYPFLPLSSLKNGEFDKACESDEVRKYALVVVGHSHSNFVKGNVASVSAAGLEGASYLIIEDNGDSLTFEHISLDISFL